MRTDSVKAAGLALLALPILAGCVHGGSEMTAIPARIDYVCAGQRVLPVARSEDARVAAVLLDGQEYRLVRAPSAAQEKFSDGRLSLYLEGERAMLEDNGRVLLGPCTSPVPLPTYYR